MVAGILTTLGTCAIYSFSGDVMCTIFSSHPLPTVDWIPLVGQLVSFSMLILSMALGSSLSLVVIAIAWLRYHPLYGLAVLLIAAAPFIVSKFTSSKNSAGKGS